MLRRGLASCTTRRWMATRNRPVLGSAFCTAQASLWHTHRTFLFSSTQASTATAAVGEGETEESNECDSSPQHRRFEESIAAIKRDRLKPYDGFGFVSDATYTTPMVLLLGNHSSGKSTLINYLCGRDIQQTGVAPTDDGFTIIQRGKFDMNDDGPTAVSTPKYKFQVLQPFGFGFVTRFRIKSRSMPASSKVPFDMMLVDSPGMIDTPVHVRDRTTEEGQLRGYDFLGVTRWFAQRSDVILLMFDPANPGTTGETLDVLTKSLSGLEHKFLVVMNKVDMFEKVTDFARAYGTLCWNLSKVIPMKDIPHIYTTCTPQRAMDPPAPAPPARAKIAESVTEQGGAADVISEDKKEGSATAAAAAAQPVSAAVIPPQELDRQRNEILEEILAAPLRRLDNLITETEESARCVLLAGNVCRQLKREYTQRVVSVSLIFGSLCLAVPLALFSTAQFSLTGTVALALASVAVGGAASIVTNAQLKVYHDALLHSMDGIVDRLYPGKEKTKEVELRWQNQVKGEILRLAHANAGERTGIHALPTLSSRAASSIRALINDELPALRAEVGSLKQREYKKRWDGRAIQ